MLSKLFRGSSMIWRFGSLLFHSNSFSTHENGSNFAMCSRDKIHAAFLLHISMGDKDRNHPHTLYIMNHPIRSRAFTWTQQGVRWVTHRISGNSQFPRNNLARVGQETLQSRVSNSLPAARYKWKSLRGYNLKSPETWKKHQRLGDIRRSPHARIASWSGSMTSNGTSY